ncbi:MAG TPA: type II secretion system F family protein [Firmicutes bacterium]|nr:type II secretion system F family protein [Bacillota bacterium]
MLFLISAGSFLCSAAIVYYIGQRRLETLPEERLSKYQSQAVWELGRKPQAREAYPPAAAAAVGRAAIWRQRIAGPALLVMRFLPRTYIDNVEKQLTMAGGFASLRVAEYIFLRLFLALCSPLFLSVLTGGRGGLSFFLQTGALGWLVPRLLVKRRIAARQKAILKSLPDTVDLLTVSVEAGLGFDAALQRVAAKITGPLSDEFNHFLRAVRMGAPRQAALRALAERSGVPELRAFTSAIIQADQLGVSIGDVLRIQSEDIRRKRRQKAEELAMKAPIKMLFPMIFFIFPSLFIVLLGPAAIHLMIMFMSLSLQR